MTIKFLALRFCVCNTYHKYKVDEEYVRKEVYGPQKVVDVLNFVVVKVSNSCAEKRKHWVNEGTEVSDLSTVTFQ